MVVLPTAPTAAAVAVAVMMFVGSTDKASRRRCRKALRAGVRQLAADVRLPLFGNVDEPVRRNAAMSLMAGCRSCGACKGI